MSERDKESKRGEFAPAKPVQYAPCIYVSECVAVSNLQLPLVPKVDRNRFVIGNYSTFHILIHIIFYIMCFVGC